VRIESGVVQDPIQSVIEGMRRGRRQITRRNPQGLLSPPMFAFCHRHVHASVVRMFDSGE
jgi:hypothetical protein